MNIQEEGASHDGFRVLVSTGFSIFQNQKLAHDLPHPSWVYIKTYKTMYIHICIYIYIYRERERERERDVRMIAGDVARVARDVVVPRPAM